MSRYSKSPRKIKTKVMRIAEVLGMEIEKLSENMSISQPAASRMIYEDWLNFKMKKKGEYNDFSFR